MDVVIKTPHHDIHHAYTIDNPLMKSLLSEGSQDDECLKTKENPMLANNISPFRKKIHQV